MFFLRSCSYVADFSPFFLCLCWLTSLGNRDGDTKVACILHAHLLLLFKNLGVDDVNKTVASVVLSAQVWLWYGYGMVMVWLWYGMLRYGMVWYGMVWYGMEWYGMVWYGMVCTV